jgi:hypothetical protein
MDPEPVTAAPVEKSAKPPASARSGAVGRADAEGAGRA